MIDAKKENLIKEVISAYFRADVNEEGGRMMLSNSVDDVQDDGEFCVMFTYIPSNFLKNLSPDCHRGFSIEPKAIAHTEFLMIRFFL